MKDLLLQHTKSQMAQVREFTKSGQWKWIYGLSFLVGFFLLIIFGKAFVLESTLLDVDALREVKDAVVDKKAFEAYVFRNRLLWVMAGIVIWWWGIGKWYIYGVLGLYGFFMGACLQTTILRYGTKGVFLWMVLYFPHAIFYIGALLCALLFVNAIPNRNITAWKLELLRRWLLLVGIILLCIAGMYSESHWNVDLLQNYLQFF